MKILVIKMISLQVSLLCLFIKKKNKFHRDINRRGDATASKFKS